jgi:Pro-kumamolisin, activation domain/Domain of unknown function (DUF5011)/Viral BACON domain/Immunoglobulin I-set domain
MNLTIGINSANVCEVNQNGDFKFPRLFFAITIGLTLIFSLSASAQTPPRKFLHGHVPPAATKLRAIGFLPATNQMRLAIGLPLRNEAALDEFLQQLYDPASPNFRKYLTPQQFTEQFGPTESDYEKVIAFARANGLTVTGTYGNRVLLDVSGTADNVEKAFQVKLRVYQHPRELRTFFAPDIEPSVETDLPILDISGLNNFDLPHPKNLKIAPAIVLANATPKSGSGSGGTYLGNDFRAAYVPGVSLDGSGQTVGLLEFDGYYSGDIASYESQAGLANIPLQNVPVNGGVGTPGTGNVEVALDIEMAISMATNLSAVVVFEAPNTSTFNSLLNTMVASNQIKQLSCSWGGGSANASSENIFKNMAAQGQSFFNAAGDSDAFVGSIPFPSESTNITQVGGTTLTTSGPGGAWVSETVWNWGYDSSAGSYVGSSGGISTTYSIPTWQQGISMTANQGSTTMRNIPDVALTADNVFVAANNGGSETVGGTSCAAPLWAGLIALANQQAARNGQSPVGFINPVVYEIGRESAYAADFHDITTGNNTWPSSPANFCAAVGYDLCTGWGTPHGSSLINDLVNPDPFVITPLSGFNFSGPFGGPFTANSQNLLLTNSGAGSLNWSVGSIPSWLNVSSGGGTLPSGAGTSVTVSLNSTANTLTSGTYLGYLWLTNLTSGIGHSRLFTLQVNDPLEILPTNGFAASGPVGGPFNLTSQNILLTNLSSTSINWSLANLPPWLTAASATGTLPPFNGSTITLNLNSTSSNLSAGIYVTNLTFADTTTGSVQTRPAALSVGQPLVQNGGFETGDFTDWTLIGDGGNVDFVDSGTYITPHSGNYVAALGEVGTTLATLSQSLPTSVGQTYLLSLWLDSPNVSSYTPNRFVVAWNGVTLFDKSNIGRIGWTNLQFTVKATASSTVLQFGARDDNWYLGLDDITLTPILPPSLNTQPTNQTVVAGNNAIFSAIASGTLSLIYHWRKNNTNLVNSGNISGATSNVLTITIATTNNIGNYSLVVTNAYGSITSSVAALTIAFPPAITSSLTNQTIECGGNAAFAINVSGTSPFSYQWSLDNITIANATNASLSLANVHQPNHIVAVVVTNLYGSVTNSELLTVQDTIAPVITLNGSNPMFVELGFSFTDPGATANDICAGAVVVVTSGTVNTGAIGTNLLFYSATDGNGNTNIIMRTVIVRDTTPPNINWSFTNLVLAADTNCGASMPDVTGTNFVLATDLSGAVVIFQNPTNNFILPLGTNLVVITVADASGNASYSTNTIVVQDQTPPEILSEPQNQTNFIGTTAQFNVVATACTPLTYQWFFNNDVITNQTNDTLALASVSKIAAGNYSVVVSASGGSVTSLVATLTVNLIPPGIIPNPAINSDGSFTLNLTGSPGCTYILEVTADLFSSVIWQPIATNTLGTNGVWQFNDTSATNFSQRFYRLKLAQ